MIGKVIKHLLDQNPELLELVPTTRIFPYVLNEDTPLPAIVYLIEGSVPQYEKDGWAGDLVNFSVVSLASNYSVLQDIAAEVRVALSFKEDTVDDIVIGRVRMIGFEEMYLGDSIFMNKLIFNTIMKSY
jgi:hypothetical protein